MYFSSFNQRIFIYFKVPTLTHIMRIQIVNTGNLHFEAKPFGKYKMKKKTHTYTHKFRETINHCVLNIRMYRNETY